MQRFAFISGLTADMFLPWDFFAIFCVRHGSTPVLDTPVLSTPVLDQLIAQIFVFISCWANTFSSRGLWLLCND